MYTLRRPHWHPACDVHVVDDPVHLSTPCCGGPARRRVHAVRTRGAAGHHACRRAHVGFTPAHTGEAEVAPTDLSTTLASVGGGQNAAETPGALDGSSPGGHHRLGGAGRSAAWAP